MNYNSLKDIDECAIPELASKCVRNAECCNLPAHYVCKCGKGFEGDGNVECRDIGEDSGRQIEISAVSICRYNVD